MKNDELQQHGRLLSRNHENSFIVVWICLPVHVLLSLPNIFQTLFHVLNLITAIAFEKLCKQWRKLLPLSIATWPLKICCVIECNVLLVQIVECFWCWWQWCMHCQAPGRTLQFLKAKVGKDSKIDVPFSTSMIIIYFGSSKETVQNDLYYSEFHWKSKSTVPWSSLDMQKLCFTGRKIENMFGWSCRHVEPLTDMIAIMFNSSRDWAIYGFSDELAQKMIRILVQNCKELLHEPFRRNRNLMSTAIFLLPRYLS